MNLDRIGKYRVVGKIGKGAMGEVYKAQDPLLNRFVAIKTIAPAFATEPDFRRRFQREAQSAAQLNHPNIVTVFDFGEEDGFIYMAMELLEGRDLRSVIRSREAHLGDKLAIMEQLCDGLGFAHTKGIIHRDLKPGNIHVQRNGQVKILDFGLARLGDSDITRTGTVMGTPNYMSPEQIRGQKVDARSDVFSLGAVFYELLSHHRPFEADSAHDVRFQIAERTPEPIRKWAPDVPLALVSIVDRALAKDPAGRFADAREMGQALALARDVIESDTIARPGASEGDRTVLQSGDATAVQPSEAGRSYGTVRGATALTLARNAGTGLSPMPRTVRPDPTVAGAPATDAPARSAPSRAVLVGGAAALATAVAVGVVWLRSRAPTPGTAPAVAGPEQAGIMTDVFVTNQVELARADLLDREYASAAQRAEEALKLNPASADAREVLEEARRAERQIEDAVADARAAWGRRDTVAASVALGRVMTLAPHHPVVAELSTELQQHLRPQAEESRRAAQAARRLADGAGARSLTAYGEGGQLASEADALLQRQDYANATQKYVEARSFFERARRDADVARAAAARPSPSAPPPVLAAAAPGTLPSPSAAPTVRPLPTPTAAAPTAPPTATPLPSPSATLPPAPRADAQGAVMQALADYKRAVESQDIALFRAVKPDLSADDEKNLRKSFESIKSQTVGISVDSIQIEGDRATVQVTRQDVVNGRQMKAYAWTVRLARSGGRWLIQ